MPATTMTLETTDAKTVVDFAPGIQHTGGDPIRVRNVNAWYGDFQSLINLNLDMPVRKVTGLIGPSGCGKSTFLRWINRMNDQIDSARAEGSIEIGGNNILAPRTDVVELRRHVGMVFQKPNPFPKSIYDNVADTRAVPSRGPDNRWRTCEFAARLLSALHKDTHLRNRCTPAGNSWFR